MGGWPSHINGPTAGRWTRGTARSDVRLGFTSKADTTVDTDTVPAASTDGELYRVDVATNNSSIVSRTSVRLFDPSWTHDL